MKRFIAILLTAFIGSGALGSVPADAQMQNASRTLYPFFTQQALTARWLAGGIAFFGHPHRRIGPLLRKNFMKPSQHRERIVTISGTFATSFGFGIQIVAEPFLTYQLTHSASAVGVITMVSPLAMSFFALFGGILAGHFSNKGMVGIQVIRSLSPFAISSWLWIAGSPPFWVIVVGAIATGICQSVGVPMTQTMLNEITDEQQVRGDVEYMLGSNQIQTQLGRTAGTLVATYCLVTFGPASSFFLVGVSYLMSAFAFSSLRTVLKIERGNFHKRILNSIKVSWKAARKNPLFVGFMAIFGLAAGLGYPIFSLSAPAVDHLLHLAPVWQGRLQTAFVVGSLAATYLWTSERVKPYRRRFFLGALALFGLCSVLFSYGTSAGLALFLEGIAGATYIWPSLVLSVAVHTTIRKDFVPRAFGMLYFFWYLGQSAGNYKAGQWANQSTVGDVLWWFGISLLGTTLGLLVLRGKYFKVIKATGTLWAKGARAA